MAPPAPRPTEVLHGLYERHILCYDHHLKMKSNQPLPKTKDKPLPFLVFACMEPGCPIRYHISRGYFIVESETELIPSVRCPFDGMFMYLAEVNPKVRNFRLWKCPRCGASRSNEEGLVGAA